MNANIVICSLDNCEHNPNRLKNFLAAFGVFTLSSRLNILFRIYFCSLNRTFGTTIHRRTFSSSENETKAPATDEPTELERKLQTEVESLTGQVAKLTEKSDELLVSEFRIAITCMHVTHRRRWYFMSFVSHLTG